MKKRQYTKLTGVNVTEAILDIDYYEAETHVSVPHEFAVEAAKEWIEENQK